MFVKFQLSGSNTFGDMRESQMYGRGSGVPYKPLAEKISHPTTVFGPTYALVAFQLSSCNSFVDMKGVPNVQ